MTVPEGAGIWKKASYSGQTSDCVEVALGAIVAVRDTKARAAGQLTVTGDAWEALLASVR